MKVEFPKTSFFQFYTIKLLGITALAHRSATGRASSRPDQEINFMAFFGVFKDGDYEYDSSFMAAHIAQREKVFFG